MNKAICAFAICFIEALHGSGTGEKALPFRLEGIDGKSAVVNPAALRRPLLVHLFSVQKPGWEQELLSLKSLYEEFEKKGLAVVSAAARSHKAAEILAPFAVKNEIRFPIGIDAKEGPFSSFASGTVPRAVLIGPDGTARLNILEDIHREQINAIRNLLPTLLEERNYLLRQDKRRTKEETRSKKAFEKAVRELKTIAPEELRRRQEAGENLNLRFIGPRSLFEKHHILGALHMDFEAVEDDFRDKDHSQEWIFYCACDKDDLGLSGRAAMLLRRKGFKRASYLKGHLQAWQEKGFPLSGDRKSD